MWALLEADLNSTYSEVAMPENLAFQIKSSLISIDYITS